MDNVAEFSRLVVEKVLREVPTARVVPGELREVSTSEGGSIDAPAPYARVHLDGDPEGVLVDVVVLARAPTEPGTRVAVLLNPPHGAFLLDGFGSYLPEFACAYHKAWHGSTGPDTVSAAGDGGPGTLTVDPVVTVDEYVGTSTRIDVTVRAAIIPTATGSVIDWIVQAIVNGVTMNAFQYGATRFVAADTGTHRMTVHFHGVAAPVTTLGGFDVGVYIENASNEVLDVEAVTVTVAPMCDDAAATLYQASE